MALVLPLSTLQTITPDSTVLTEETVWDRLRQGEAAALATLHTNYYQRLFRYGLKLTQDPVISEDSIQDLFATLWASRQQISPVKSVTFYLFSSYRRLILRHLKKQQKSLTLFFKPEPDLVFSAEEILVRTEADRETAHHLRHILNSLPKRQKEAIYLRYYEELTFEEVAQVMNLNYQSVLNHLHRALTNIRQRPDAGTLLGRSAGPVYPSQSPS